MHGMTCGMLLCFRLAAASAAERERGTCDDYTLIIVRQPATMETKRTCRTDQPTDAAVAAAADEQRSRRLGRRVAEL